MSQTEGRRCLHGEHLTGGGTHVQRTTGPEGEERGLYGDQLKRFSRKLLGEVPGAGGEMMWHNPCTHRLHGVLPQGPVVGPARREPVVVRPHGVHRAGRLSCCLDLGYCRAHNEGRGGVKAGEVPVAGVVTEDLQDAIILFVAVIAATVLLVAARPTQERPRDP